MKEVEYHKQDKTHLRSGALFTTKIKKARRIFTTSGHIRRSNSKYDRMEQIRKELSKYP